MATLVMRGRQWLREPFVTGFLLLVILITLFLGKPLFANQPLLAADLLYHLDPLWQPMAPPGFTVPTNQVLSDQVFEFYPWQKFVREALAAGQLPLWNPYVYAGHPLLANAQSAPFDPFNLLAYLWPLAQSFVVVAFLRLLCAGSFTLLLALELGMSRWAAYVSMVTFTFAMPQVVWLLYPKASVLVWLPAILFLSLRVIRFGRWRDAGLLGLVMAAQIVGGHPETVLYSVLLWGAFCLYWLWAEAESVMRRALQLVSAGLLGMGAGAMQWLPVAEALLNSEILANRSQSSLTWESIFLQWREWLAGVTMLMPNFFGNPRHADYWNKPSMWGCCRWPLPACSSGGERRRGPSCSLVLWRCLHWQWRCGCRALLCWQKRRRLMSPIRRVCAVSTCFVWRCWRALGWMWYARRLYMVTADQCGCCCDCSC
jgi:hypothetical protein